MISAGARRTLRAPRIPRGRFRILPVALAALVAGGVVSSASRAAEAPDPPPHKALVIERGSVATRQVVALGRDLEIAGEAASDVAAVDGSVEITGSVEGDVIVLGGSARLGSSARVDGDVFVLGGSIETEPGAHIEGRSVAYPSVGSAWVILIGGPSLGRSAFSAVTVGAKLALVAAWLAWTLLLFATGGREVLSTADGIREQPFRNFGVGLSGVLAIFLTVLLLSAFAASLVGVPLLLLAVLVALLLKLWGMAAVFHALGDWIVGRVFKRRWMPLNAAVLGLGVLGILKLIPWIGVWSWTIASLIAVGASLTTKFGRREPWFEGAMLPAPAETLDARR